MARSLSPGQRLRNALAAERPLQIAGVINAYCAVLAETAGFRALYLSGAGVANASRGLPDLGLTSLSDVVEDTRRIASATTLPLLVDADTGFGDEVGPDQCVTQLAAAGAAGLHLEDQVSDKRCGHRPNVKLVDAAEMMARVKAACDARPDPDFVIMARTDATAVEGLDAAIARMKRYIEAGADMIFAEALGGIEDYRRVTTAITVPILANITEYGSTPLLGVNELRQAGVAMALYPLSAFRAMSRAAEEVYVTLRRDGHQRALLDRMQTRQELYDYLNYHEAERELDERQK